MNIIIYTTNWCIYCDNAKRYLNELSLEYEEINIEEKGWGRGKLFELTGGRTVPQIVINGKTIGGYVDLLKFGTSGELMV